MWTNELADAVVSFEVASLEDADDPEPGGRLGTVTYPEEEF